MAFAITSDVQRDIIVITRTPFLREAVEEYLTQWYPEAKEITVKRIAGGDWSDK